MKCYRKVGTQQGRNITICIAISSDIGLAYYEIRAGGQTKESFANFLQILSGNIVLASGVDIANADTVCIFDNAKSHANIENEFVNILPLKRLPTYSPMLNPAENAISSWKAEIKKKLAENMTRFVSPTVNDLMGRNLQEYRFDSLKEIIESTKDVITAGKCLAWFNRTLTYIPQCLNREIIDG